MKEGPWSYRLISVAIIMPMYSLILMCIGTVFRLCSPPSTHRLHHVNVATLTSPLPPRTTATIFGRHAYFKKVVMRMWGRFLPSRWMKTIEGKK